MMEIVHNFNSKCGEIHSYNAMLFSFTCNFCSLILNSFEEFCLHIREVHFETTDSCTSVNEAPESVENIEENKSEVSDLSRAEEDVEYFELVKIESPADNDIIENYDENEETIESPENMALESESLNETEVDIDELQADQVLIEEEVEEEIQEPTLLPMCNESKEEQSSIKMKRKSKYIPKKKNKPIVRVFNCSHCGKSFKNKSNRNMHELRHKDIGDFQCHLCPKAFYTKMELTKHLRSHNDERPYVCEVCGKAFRHIWVLKKHSNTHLTLERTLPCPNCGKLFATKDHLRIHMLTHNTIPLFRCDYCGQRFTQRKRMNAHKRRHHRDE